jgi:hypothetical protein
MAQTVQFCSSGKACCRSRAVFDLNFNVRRRTIRCILNSGVQFCSPAVLQAPSFSVSPVPLSPLDQADSAIRRFHFGENRPSKAPQLNSQLETSNAAIMV